MAKVTLKRAITIIDVAFDPSDRDGNPAGLESDRAAQAGAVEVIASLFEVDDREVVAHVDALRAERAAKKTLAALTAKRAGKA